MQSLSLQAPLKLRPYSAIQICLLLLLLFTKFSDCSSGNIMHVYLEETQFLLFILTFALTSMSKLAFCISNWRLELAIFVSAEYLVSIRAFSHSASYQQQHTCRQSATITCNITASQVNSAWPYLCV